MDGNRPDELLSYARELELRDADVAARIEAAGALLARVDEVRERARRVGHALAELPGEIEHAEEALGAARAREADAVRDLAEAERECERVQGSKRAGEEIRLAAERGRRRAAVAVTDAADAVSRSEERLRQARSDEVALQAETEGLAVEARAVAQDVAELPRLSETGRAAPGTSLEQIDQWGARAHAAIFVVRGSLDAERDRLVHEANAMATAALGEQVAGASVALVRRRLEEEL